MKDYSETKGYLQTTIAGEKVWLHFGMNALKILQDEFNLTLTELGERMSSEEVFDRYGAFGDLIYAGRKSYNVQHGLEADFNRASCLEHVLTMADADIKAFTTAISYMNGIDYITRNAKKLKQETILQKESVSTN